MIYVRGTDDCLPYLKHVSEGCAVRGKPSEFARLRHVGPCCLRALFLNALHTLVDVLLHRRLFALTLCCCLVCVECNKLSVRPSAINFATCAMDNAPCKCEYVNIPFCAFVLCCSCSLAQRVLDLESHAAVGRFGPFARGLSAALGRRHS